MKHRNLKIVDLCLPLDESILEIQISLCEEHLLRRLQEGWNLLREHEAENAYKCADCSEN